MYNDKLDQNTITVIFELSTPVTINFINYQFLIQSKPKSTQSKFKSKVIKSADVKKVYISENNDDDDDSNGDEPISYDIESGHFITFIKTRFVVSESINTNIFIVSFTSDASVFDNEVFQQHFITFIKTLFVVSESINTNIFIVSFAFDASILDSEVSQQHLITFIKTFFVVSESINTNIFVVSFTFNTSVLDNEVSQQHSITFIKTFHQFVLSSLFENASELSIFFSKIVYIVFSNESNNDDACDVDDAAVKKTLLIKFKIDKISLDFQFVTKDSSDDAIVFQNIVQRIFENILNTLKNPRRSISKNFTISYFIEHFDHYVSTTFSNDLNDKLKSESFFDFFKTVHPIYKPSPYLNVFSEKHMSSEDRQS